MASIKLENVSKIFDNGVTAVNNATLEIRDGEFMVIVGPSGCGKTTMLRMIAGLEEVGSGTIRIDDAVVNDIPPHKRDVAMVFQNYALYPHMTAFENMAFNLKLRKHPKAQIQARVKEVAQMLGIEELLDRKPKELSGGQRQRIALGRAIVQRPKVFLFDEPLSNVDAQARAVTRLELRALHNRLTATSIYVTHDQSEAMSLGDRICVMCNGVIQQIGGPLDIYNRPANKFVAEFFGTPPMNFLKGHIDLRNRSVYFSALTDSFCLPEQMKNGMEKYHNKEVLLGIRPESLSIIPINGQRDNVMQVSVQNIEHLGDHINVHSIYNSGEKIIANLPWHTKMHVGQSINLYIDMARIHLFESDNIKAELPSGKQPTTLIGRSKLPRELPPQTS